MPVWFLASIPGPCSSPLLWYETWIFLISVVFALINEDSVPETLHHCAHLSSTGAWLVLRGYDAQNSSSLPADITSCFTLTHCGAGRNHSSLCCTLSLWWPFWFFSSLLCQMFYFFLLFLPTEAADVGSTHVVYLPAYLWPIHFNFVLHGDSWSSGLVIYDY